MPDLPGASFEEGIVIFFAMLIAMGVTRLRKKS